MACLLASAVPAAAQSVLKDPSEAARFRIGGFRFTPFLAITDLGVDTNVYNESDSENPKQDTTATLGPGLEYWFRLGRARVAAKTDVTYSWFRQYSDQRSWNTDNSGTITLPINRLSLFADGIYLHGRVRPGFEIDTRSFRTDAGYGGGLDMRVSAKSTVRVEAHKRSMDFKDDEFYNGTNLSRALNRDTTSGAVSLRQALTPLTTFVVKTEYLEDRFEFASLKDANAVAILPGFELDPLALISGKVFVGYRHYDALNPLVPDYSGLIGNVEATYHAHATKFLGKFNRDITYSYETSQPYYLLTDVGLEVTQRITTRWDIVGDVGHQWLGYRQLEVGTSVAEDRTDRSYRVGGGTGYRLGENVRVGVLVEYYHRSSNTRDLRQYNGLRMGGSFTYGLPQ
jgi:Putative beta-barrel porin 2